jgi:surfactin family lipopeptide synthetase A
LDHSGVREAVVAVRDEDGEKRLVGYVVAEAEESELRDYLAQRLPSYMVPATLLKLDQLPLTPNGKVDRRALPAPDEFIRAAYVAPRSESERLLVDIWSEVLNRQNIGIHDNFFELGGHSLLATRIISQVIKRFQVQVPLRSLFESPTIAALSEAIEKARENQGSAPQSLSIKRVSREAHRVNAATLKSH